MVIKSEDFETLMRTINEEQANLDRCMGPMDAESKSITLCHGGRLTCPCYRE